MTPEQLRASILQQAMEGKLVKQDPNDEPASILFEKITKEKARLIKEKKIKRTKKLPEITDDEKPFEIPDSWEWVRLITITNFGNFKSVNGLEIPDDAWLLDMKDMNKNGGGFRQLISKNEVGSVKSNKYVVTKNDVLYGKLRPYLKKVEIAPQPGYTTTEIFPIHTIANLTLATYLRYCLLSPYFVDTVNSSMYGMKMPRVGTKFLGSMSIPFPPLAEQKRIVARLDQLMPLVDEYAEAYDKLKKLDDGFNDKFKQSLLQYAMEGKLVKQDFNDISAINNLENARKELTTAMNNKKMRKEKYSYADTPSTYPKNWRAARLIELCKKKNGSIRRGPFGSAITKSMFVKKGTDTFKIYEQGNAINHTVQYGTYYMPNSEFSRLKSFEVHAGDIIISCAGTIGKTYILPDNMEKGIINQALMKLEIDESIIDKHCFLLAFKNVTKQLQENAKGSAIKNLASLKYLKNKVTFPLPPLAEQKRIVAKLDQLMSIMH